MSCEIGVGGQQTSLLHCVLLSDV